MPREEKGHRNSLPFTSFVPSIALKWLTLDLTEDKPIVRYISLPDFSVRRRYFPKKPVNQTVSISFGFGKGGPSLEGKIGEG